MHRRQLLFALTVGLALSFGAHAQTSSPDAGTAPATGAAKPLPAKKKSSKSSKKGKKTPPPPKQPDIDEETRKALEAAPTPTPPANVTPVPAEAPKPAPGPEAVAPPPAPAEVAPQQGSDEDAPVLTAAPPPKVIRGKAFTMTAHATDPSGVFGPVFYLRKKGMSATEYIPMRMQPSKTSPGDYALEVPAPLVSVDALEYYIEAWDNLGNGPARVGNADSPLQIKVEEPPRPKEVPKPPVIAEKPKGNPPSITHQTVSTAPKGQPIELNARLVGETGVSGPAVMFRHVGEREYKALPMGFLGGDDYTATIPASMATGDIEYYLEAFDKYGNGPGRNGAPNIPYVIKITEPKPVAGFAGPTGPPPPRLVKAPFKPNFGRAAGWAFMGGFVGGLAFAGGEALAAGQAHDEYTHTFEFEGRLDDGLLKRANTYGSRAKTALIVSGASLVVGVVLLVVFPEYPETILVPGGGGDIGVRF